MPQRNKLADESTAEIPAAEKPVLAPLAVVSDFASDQRENAPEESAEDLARKTLAGETPNVELLPTNPAETPPPPASGPIDRSGERFDPAIHAQKPDGTPAYAKSGVFRRRRGTGARVRIPGASTPLAVVTVEDQKARELAAQAADEMKRRKAQIAGSAIAEIIFKSGHMLGGDEWLPIKDDSRQLDERRDMHTVWSEYCLAKNIDDIPPGVLVAFVVSAYALPRFSGKETQKRLGALGTGFKKARLWFANWRLDRSAKNAARIADRNDGKRENDTSKGDSVSAS